MKNAYSRPKDGAGERRINASKSIDSKLREKFNIPHEEKATLIFKDSKELDEYLKLIEKQNPKFLTKNRDK